MSHVNWALGLVGGGEDCDMMYDMGVILIVSRYGGVVEIEVDIKTLKCLYENIMSRACFCRLPTMSSCRTISKAIVPWSTSYQSF